MTRLRLAEGESYVRFLALPPAAWVGWGLIGAWKGGDPSNIRSTAMVKSGPGLQPGPLKSHDGSRNTKEHEK